MALPKSSPTPVAAKPAETSAVKTQPAAAEAAKRLPAAEASSDNAANNNNNNKRKVPYCSCAKFEPQAWRENLCKACGKQKPLGNKQNMFFSGPYLMILFWFTFAA